MEKTPIVVDEAMVREFERQDSDVLSILRQTELWDITYESDGLRIKGVLAYPRDSHRDGYPCIVYNRGGRSDFGAITPETVIRTLARIASWGYVVIASQYRGNMGSGGKDEYGGRDIHDVLNLIPLLERIASADPTRIGIMGRSRGGLLTYQALALTNRFSAAIVTAGIADFFDLVSRRPRMEQEVLIELVPEFNQTREQALLSRSPIYWVERLCKTTPLLLLHGSADWRVHPTQAIRMALALYEQRHPFRLVFLEGADHDLTEFRCEVFQMYRSWLDRYVRDREQWPSLEPH